MKSIKRILFSFLVVIVGFAFQFASFAKTDSQGSIIKNIKFEYHSTNKNLRSYKVIEKTLYGYSLEGSSLKLYYSNKRLKKIYIKNFGETGYSASEYYFKNSKLIFYYNEYVYYDKPFGKIASKRVDRMYFYNNSLIKWLRNKKNVPYKKKLYQETYKKIKSNIKEFLVAEKLPGKKITYDEILKALSKKK